MNLSFFKKKEEIAKEYVDRNKKKIVWYKESYDNHINIRHFDVKSCQDKISKALKTPQLIRIDNKRKVTHYFYLQRTNIKGVNVYIQVIVDYNSNPARIKTVYLTSHTNGATIC